ncbi:hypothetical protein ACJMK2_014004 [Sinanodonta woodiana]|uniref:MD-2-related lipid-recognition domain-containing protein n=1 Tax=Sinanodonta woodiana TaxID=1069815 RepID=A0ABD3V2K9_SINWO
MAVLFFAILAASASWIVEGNVKREITSLQWSSCNTNRNSPITIQNVAVTPMPVEVPGDIHLTVDAKLNRSISHTSLKLSIKRKTFLLDIPIPCLFHVGSCTYDDLCNTVDQMMTEDWAGIMSNIGKQIRTMMTTQHVPDHCPVGPMEVHLNSYTLTLPPIPKILTFFAAFLKLLKSKSEHHVCQIFRSVCVCLPR